ncbi:EDD domain protein, DegV family [Tissierella praeacuta DSM 18095]|uniref:EDD domain protein, DegV family n=1 Tax=Tissierella praeacuta DSM 18095 TaxID=1123404 RepID=A0A1M4W4C5_9FIRM|nr:DegV family protein [Tissierella praeacuta]SHE76088.1 EDD domain protein, DegV family [Tissierella praeacuta DSM 18095]SUP00110.1 DegV domain-containing protein SAV1425 [Tissierella praeacuta]
MNYKIVADSSCDLNEELKQRLNISLVPFKIDIDNKKFIDNEEINMVELIDAMKSSPNPIRTSCPSPGDFVMEYKNADNIFAITISGKLSGTYNSAVLAKDMAKEEEPDKFIHVFDSKSASVGETLIAMKIQELIEKKLNNFEIVEKVEKYINGMKTYFVLENLDNLIKNGRISKTKGLIANVLNLKPIMGEDGEGNIKLVENVRGTKKAFKRLVEIIGETGEKFEEKILAISHVNAFEKAEELKKEIQKRYNFKDIILVKTAGLSSAYANDGGIILVF